MMVARRCRDRGSGGIRSLTTQGSVPTSPQRRCNLFWSKKNSKKSGAAFPTPTCVPGATDPRVGVIDNGIGSALAPWTLGRIDHLTATQVDAVHGTNVAGILLAGQAGNGPAIPPDPVGRERHDGAEEMAGMVLFLRSGAASHVTGRALVRGRRSNVSWAGAGRERDLRRQGVRSHEAVPRAKALAPARTRNSDRHVYSDNPSQITMQ